MLLPRSLDIRVRRLLEAKGYVFVRGQDALALARRKRVIEAHSIDLVIDVGANSGQYGCAMRELGYEGRIHSFEPMNSAWVELQRRITGDALWKASQMALGEAPGTKILHIAGNSISSSVLDMLPAHESNAPQSRYVKDEQVAVSTLDEEFPKINGNASRIWLKLDVQGYESKVLEGATRSLNAINVIQTEMSLTPLYADQVTYLALCEKLAMYGFNLVGVEAGFQDRSNGQLLQIDGIFARNESSPNGS